jgi:hypothetical protein
MGRGGRMIWINGRWFYAVWRHFKLDMILIRGLWKSTGYLGTRNPPLRFAVCFGLAILAGYSAVFILLFQGRMGLTSIPDVFGNCLIKFYFGERR